MESRKIAILLSLFAATLLLFSTSTPLGNSFAQSFSPLIQGAPSFIELGFGPNSLSPARQGAPIFTVNDSLWIYSSLAQPVTAKLVNPANDSTIRTILPSEILSIHEFSGSDLGGVWTLYFTLQNSTYYAIPISFVNLPQNQIPVSLSEYSIQNGQINLRFSVVPQDAYDQQGCLTSKSSNSTFSLNDPSIVGSGTVTLSINATDDSAIVAASGQVASTFSFWFELDYSYTYTAGLVNETVSRIIPVGRSSTVLFNSSGTETVSLPILSNLRTGRYQIRGYFDSSSGFAAAQTTVLYMGDGSWFWLSSCNPFSVTGATFSKQVNLAQNPSSWPSTLYFLYQHDGIESFSVVPLQINLARLDFVGTPGNAQLSDFTYSVANNSNVEASGIFSGSIYLIAKTYPLSLTVTPMLGSEALSPVNVLVSAPFTDTQTEIPIGRLTVEVLNNSRPDLGASVDVSNSLGASLSSTIPSGGNTSFNLPAGFYQVTVSKSGATEVGNATVFNGNNTIITISVSSPQIPRSYLELLLAPLFLGLVLNVWAWVVAPRRARYPRLETG